MELELRSSSGTSNLRNAVALPPAADALVHAVARRAIAPPPSPCVSDGDLKTCLGGRHGLAARQDGLAATSGWLGRPVPVCKSLATNSLFLAGSLPDFSPMGIVPDDAAVRRVFVGDLPFPPALAFRHCSILTLLRPNRGCDYMRPMADCGNPILPTCLWAGKAGSTKWRPSPTDHRLVVKQQVYCSPTHRIALLWHQLKLSRQEALGNSRGGSPVVCPAAEAHRVPPPSAVRAAMPKQGTVGVTSLSLSPHGAERVWQWRARPVGEHLSRAGARFTWACGGVVVRLLASHLGESGSSPGGVVPGFSHVGIVPDDAAGGRAFSRVSRFLRPYIPALLDTRLTSSSLALKASTTDEGDRGMEQRRNERAGETGDRRENPPTNGIVRHDSHLRKVTRPGIEPGGGAGALLPHRGYAYDHCTTLCEGQDGGKVRPNLTWARCPLTSEVTIATERGVAWRGVAATWDENKGVTWRASVRAELLVRLATPSRTAGSGHPPRSGYYGGFTRSKARSIEAVHRLSGRGTSINTKYWLDYSHATEANRVRFPTELLPQSSHAEIVPDDAASRRVFSEIHRFPSSCIRALLHTHLASPSSALKASVLTGAQTCPLQPKPSSKRLVRRSTPVLSWLTPSAEEQLLFLLGVALEATPSDLLPTLGTPPEISSRTPRAKYNPFTVAPNFSEALLKFCFQDIPPLQMLCYELRETVFPNTFIHFPRENVELEDANITTAYPAEVMRFRFIASGSRFGLSTASCSSDATVEVTAKQPAVENTSLVYVSHVWDDPSRGDPPRRSEEIEKADLTTSVWSGKGPTVETAEKAACAERVVSEKGWPFSQWYRPPSKAADQLHWQHDSEVQTQEVHPFPMATREVIDTASPPPSHNSTAVEGRERLAAAQFKFMTLCTPFGGLPWRSGCHSLRTARANDGLGRRHECKEGCWSGERGERITSRRAVTHHSTAPAGTPQPQHVGEVRLASRDPPRDAPARCRDVTTAAARPQRFDWGSNTSYYVLEMMAARLDEVVPTTEKES
ncbi:hypothetical protein PR048_030479 [Dryococelus australis]|uniref:Uncharacterized protein n=1 Tax=Dryococelus australis TaxID=614101 RepID=A0ABQ9G9K2_9NEOP|nr:hypothetical protein PR048_030479 [Dryococelus australis]